MGAAVGLSGKTYERAKAVVEAAESEPARYAENALQTRQAESG